MERDDTKENFIEISNGQVIVKEELCSSEEPYDDIKDSHQVIYPSTSSAVNEYSERSTAAEEVPRKGRKLYSCSECSHVSFFKSSLQQHMMVHLSLKLFKCSECGYETNRKCRLEDHAITHISKTKLFFCSHCSFQTNWKHCLKRHLENNCKTTSYNCSECNLLFSSREKREVHLRTHSLNIKKESESEVKKPAKMKKPKPSRRALSASKSKMYTASKYNLKIKTEEINCIKTEETANDNQTKETDGNDEDSKSNLFKCSQCGFSTDTFEKFEVHTYSHVPRQKLYHCRLCSYKTNWSQCLYRHELTHSNVKLFKCNECNYETNRKEYLENHFMRHFTRSKLFKCTECSYQTNWKHSINRHSLLHSNVQILNCSYCKYKTFFKSTLEKHINKKHDSGMKDILSPSAALNTVKSEMDI